VTEHAPAVLVVEDEPQMLRFLRASLTAHDYRVLEATTAKGAMAVLTTHNPALVLLDLGLPDRSGVDVVREVREFSDVPILVISARGEERDKVTALDAGADDYLTKPFGVPELLARMRVALRHAERQRGASVQPTLEVGELRVDFERREVSVRGEAVHLTPIEYRLLSLLARHAGRVLTHRQILKEVWGPTFVERTHTVRVHMAELRKKLEDSPARPRYLVSEPGVGYRLRES
jgi:two-component system KDP operon response regulator KdpE